MGVSASLGPQRTSQIVVVGLDNAGKTTLLRQMGKGDFVISGRLKTLEFERAVRGAMTFTTVVSWDIGGRTPLRAKWRKWCQNADGFIFVIDSADKRRLEEA
mmetsp:Transcript_27749/g.49125  ORF Transcript_27749/g.49125 Transcript_27749/m.49125 type:complete len:102 (+) Transcript_27749:70-375(+)